MDCATFRKALNKMKLLSIQVVVFLVIAVPISAAKKENESRRFLSLTPFRPFVRLLGMMGIPLLPFILIRQLIAGGAALGANTQSTGGGAGMGSLGALGILAPFGAGAGLGGIGPLGGGGLRPLGGLKPLGNGGLGNLIGNAAGQAAAASGGNSLFLRKRSTEKSNRFSSLLDVLAKLERTVDKYDLSVPDCQRLIVCELHKKSINPSFGSLTEKLIQAFGVEGHLERFSSNAKSILKAARNGLQQRDCLAIYYKCPVAVAKR